MVSISDGIGLAVELQLDLDPDPLEINGQIYVSRDRVARTKRW